jgi:flagellar capping protein FliD
VKKAISDFVANYNKTQTLIDTQTASTTDSAGKVSAGILSAERDATDIADQLRNMVFASVSGLSGSLKQLSQLGIETSGYDNSLTLSDSTTLDSLLINKPNQVRDLFADSKNGLAVGLSTYLDQAVGENGFLTKKQTNLTDQSGNIDAQVIEMERVVQMDKARLTSGFVAMETAKAKSDQQATFLSQQKWS